MLRPLRQTRTQVLQRISVILDSFVKDRPLELIQQAAQE